MKSWMSESFFGWAYAFALRGLWVAKSATAMCDSCGTLAEYEELSSF
jgi:hypothetical protein